jgi:hypothetical protein
MDQAASELSAPRRRPPGEEMACLQIAIGILGLLLLIFPALTTLRHPNIEVALAGLGLLAGIVLTASGGFMGFKPERRRRAHQEMRFGGLVLAVTAVAMLVASSDGLIGWDFPVGVVFLTLAFISALAARRFGRALR